MRGHAKLAPVGNYKAGSMTKSSIIENCGRSMSNGIFGGRVLCICFFDVVWPLNHRVHRREITIWSDVFCLFYGQIFCGLVNFTGQQMPFAKMKFYKQQVFWIWSCKMGPYEVSTGITVPLRMAENKPATQAKNRYNWSCKPSPGYGWAVTNRLLVS